MKRIILILILMAMVWALSYALAFTLRESGKHGFRYPPGGRFDMVLWPLFQPIYAVHGWITPERPTHERDPHARG